MIERQVLARDAVCEKLCKEIDAEWGFWCTLYSAVTGTSMAMPTQRYS